MPNNSAWRPILLGGFSAGLADFLFASIKRATSGGAWSDPWKGVAGSLIGQAARDGGGEMVLLGAALHFFICFAAAAMLYFIVRRVTWIPRQWLVLGVLYGLAFLVVMNWVVCPLSLIGHPIYKWENMHVTAFWHIVLVGLPTAWFVSRSLRSA
jgi:hypothetical protein